MPSEWIWFGFCRTHPSFWQDWKLLTDVMPLLAGVVLVYLKVSQGEMGMAASRQRNLLYVPNANAKVGLIFQKTTNRVLLKQD